MPVHRVTLPCGTAMTFHFRRELILPSRAFFRHASPRFEWIIEFSGISSITTSASIIGATILKRKIEAEFHASCPTGIALLHIVNNQLEFHIGLDLMDDVLWQLTADSATSFCKTIGKLLEMNYVEFRATHDQFEERESSEITLTPPNSPFLYSI